MLQTVIIEDEILATNRLKRLLGSLDMEIEVVKEIDTLANAVPYLAKNQSEIDLIFLDIHLADGNSFDIFEQVEIEKPIIFTTAYDQYAIQAFKQNSVDYLLKPITEDDLKRSLKKYQKVFQNQAIEKLDYKSLAKMLQTPEEEYKKRFLVHVGAKIRSVNVEDIAFFYADHGATFFTTFDGKTYDINYSLERLTHLLDPATYYRASRKCIVHIGSIQEAYQFSRHKLKLMLQPEPKFDVFIPLDRIAEFKQWFSQ